MKLILGSVVALLAVIAVMGLLIPVTVWGWNGIPEWYLVPDVLGSLIGGTLVSWYFMEKFLQ